MKQFIANRLLTIAALFFSAKMTAQPITVTLTGNYSSDVKIYHDEPLLLVVYVTNQEAQENSRWNKAADRRLNELEELLKAGKIKQEDYDREKAKLTAGKKSISSVTIGSVGKPWASLISWKMVDTKSGTGTAIAPKMMVNPSSEEVAVLNERGYYTAYFGIDAAEIKNKPAGVYELTASVEGEKSEKLRLEISNVIAPAIIAGSEAMLLKLGQYYWHFGNGEKTIEYAGKILAKNPSSIDGLSLKGDGQLLQKIYQPALDSYTKAMKEYYRQNGTNSEPPEYLISMIDFIKKELGQ